jgi:vanadium-dependent haloperoxidase-like protein
MLLFRRVAVVAVIAATIAAAGAGAPAAAPTATCTLPAGNAAQQWDTIAQTITVGATGFQIEAFVYMAYANYAAYRAVFAHGSAQSPFLVSPDAAIATAEADVLAYYFPSQSSLLSCYRDASLANVPDGLGKLLGTIEGHRAAVTMTLGRIGDGRLPIGTVETAYPPAGPGVWQPTGPGFLPPQTPYLGRMRPFILRAADQYLPPPPPSLGSATWVHDFNETKTMGRATGSGRTQEQTDIARFYATNTVVQYNTAFRDVSTQHGFDVVQSMELIGAGSVVAADAGIACLNAKYHYWFWRPITAFNATAANLTDGNPLTVEEPGTWTPLLTTPNHPEYPAAHGCVTSSMAEVFKAVLGTDAIDVTLTSTTSPAMPTRHFATADDLQTDVVNARVWGGLHYRNSAEVGVALGRSVAQYDLSRAFGLPGGAG